MYAINLAKYDDPDEILTSLKRLEYPPKPMVQGRDINKNEGHDKICDILKELSLYWKTKKLLVFGNPCFYANINTDTDKNFAYLVIILIPPVPALFNPVLLRLYVKLSIKKRRRVLTRLSSI